MYALRKYPDPFLRKHATKVEDFDDPQLHELIEQLSIQVHELDGMGLAAPQLGVLKNVFVLRLDPMEAPEVFINPKILERSKRVVTMPEGCLSLPGKHALVDRPVSIAFEAFDRTGARFEGYRDGWFARAFQHELDHLHGRLYVDRLEQRERMKLTGGRRR